MNFEELTPEQRSELENMLLAEELVKDLGYGWEEAIQRTHQRREKFLGEGGSFNTGPTKDGGFLYEIVTSKPLVGGLGSLIQGFQLVEKDGELTHHEFELNTLADSPAKQRDKLGAALKRVQIFPELPDQTMYTLSEFREQVQSGTLLADKPTVREQLLEYLETKDAGI